MVYNIRRQKTERTFKLMRIGGVDITKKAKDKRWEFSEASSPVFIKGGKVGALIIHGFGGTPDNMRCLVGEAERLGFTVCAPLLSGHAETLGDMALCDAGAWKRDALAAYDKLKASGVEKILVCGLSMGALLSLLTAAERAGDGLIAGVMLICPPVKMRGYLRVMGVSAPFIPYLLTNETFESKHTEIYCGTASMKLRDLKRLGREAQAAAKRVNAPVLLIEAGKDDRVDPDSFRILREKLPSCEYALIEDAPHGVTYSDKADEVTRLFRQFAERYGK
jgi:carboxylesterase